MSRIHRKVPGTTLNKRPTLRGTESLFQTVCVFSNNIGMEFGVEKCVERLVIYPMSGNNGTLKIDFADLRNRNLVRSLVGILDRKYTENKVGKSIGLMYKANPFLDKHCLLSQYFSYIHS